MPKLRAIGWILALAAFTATTAARAQDGLGGTLPYSPPPSPDVADPIAVAFEGLSPAEVEDDLSPGDLPLKAIVTRGCTTELIAESRRITLYWPDIETVGPGDTFVFVAGKGVKLAIVGDASKPDQAKKLGMLVAAMMAMQERCGRKAG